MSNNILEELPARKHAPVAAAPSKKDAKGEKSTPKGGDSDEASAKRISQAVYDIRSVSYTHLTLPTTPYV